MESRYDDAAGRANEMVLWRSNSSPEKQGAQNWLTIRQRTYSTTRCVKQGCNVCMQLRSAGCCRDPGEDLQSTSTLCETRSADINRRSQMRRGFLDRAHAFCTETIVAVDFLRFETWPANSGQMTPAQIWAEDVLEKGTLPCRVSSLRSRLES